MDEFEKLKNSLVPIAWVFFGISALTTIAASRRISIGMSLYILLGAMLFINAIYTNSRMRRKINSITYLVTIIIYAIILILIVANFMGYKLFEESLSNLLFLALCLPVIFASYYYGLNGALAAAFGVIVIDLFMSFWQMKLTGEIKYASVFNGLYLSRVLFYVILALFIGYTDKYKKREEGERIFREREKERSREKELEAAVLKLKHENEELEKEKEEIELKYKKGEKIIKKSDSQEIRINALLLDLFKNLSSDLDIIAVVKTVLKKIREIIVYHSAATFLYNSDHSELFMAAHEGLYEDEMRMTLRNDIGFPYIVSQTGKHLYINNTDKDPRFQTINRTAKVKSVVYIPIELEGKVFGVVALWRMEENGYGEGDIQLLRIITREAARTIKNAELYKQLDTRLNFIVSLWETSKSLSSSLDTPQEWERVLKEVVKSISILFNADKIIFFQYRRETHEMIPYITHNINDTTKKDFIIKLRQGTSALTEFLKSRFQVKDITNDPPFAVMTEFVQTEDLKSMLWSPFIGRNRIIGALALFTTSKRIWTAEEIQWMDIFSNMFSVTLENKMLLFELTNEKSQLQTLIDNVPEGVFTTNADRQILTWNKAAEKITGISGFDIIGRDCKEYIKCGNNTSEFCADRCFIKNAMKAQDRVNSGIEKMFIVNTAGLKVPVFITAAPIVNEVGKNIGSIMVFRDITKEIEIEKMKEELLATITHDLKSPLASIMGYTELLLNPKLGPTTDTQKEFLNSILRSLKTLQILINNILESSRMDADMMTFNIVEFNLSELTSEIKEMFMPMFENKHLNFTEEIPANIDVWADREKIREVLFNLIGNALKFTPDKGTISISAKMVKGEKKVEIKVSDTGKGIPETEVSKLFQKFSQVKGEKKGTGLGLYICRKFLEAHNQNIHVKSEVGKGTSFIFTLATQKPEEPVDTAKAEKELSDSRKTQIFLK